MTPERYERAGELFHAALAVPPAERPAFVASACAGDDDLRRDVESLLTAHGTARGFIEQPAIEVAARLLAAEAAVETGTRIGRYQILASIGRGGMGEVYRALDVSLDREVALKLPRRPYAADGEAVRRFEREARAASSLNHPNIITVHEIGDADGRRFIAMELVNGHALASIVGPPVPLPALARIGRQLAQALAVAHAAGIVHGDIKPENVMVRADGYVKVLDFGVARLVEPAGDTATRPAAGGTSTLLGTPRYMAPEQARGEPATTASDVFACGAVLFELATGLHPSMAADGIRLPRPLDDLLDRMLDPRPPARPSAADVEAALAAIESLPEPTGGLLHDLPRQRTRFVGRATELTALEGLVLDGTSRLTTLTGPGGTGKTRLALEAAARVAPRFRGVSFVALAPVTHAASVLTAIAQAQGVSESGPNALVDTLAAHLRRRGPTLLVLDNFEHVTPAADVVQDLLDRCASVTILVTSRVALHLYGEQEFPVAPLALPDSDAAPPAELLQAGAIELFVQRATAVRPEFTLTAVNGRAVAEICRRLDGLPLAIELAAARVKILAPHDLRSRLDHRLELLTDGPRDLPLRQRTLRSTIDWSYDLLSPAERTLFQRMSVFAGGCSLESVEAVCDASEDLGLDVLAGVTALVNNSLVAQHAADGGESRFVMLETIREYARLRLDESGDMGATLHAHAAYALVLAEDCAHDDGPEDEAWLDACDLEHDNLRAAASHLVAAGHIWGLRLGIALFRFWERREHYGEGRQHLAAILARLGDAAPARLRAQALYYSGVLAYSQRDFDTALTLHRESHDSYRAIGDTVGEAMTKSSLGHVSWHRGHHAEALAFVEEAAALWESLGNAVAADRARSNLATVAKAAGAIELARTLLERVLAAARGRGDVRVEANALNNLGDVTAAAGQTPQARRYHEDSLARFRQIGDSEGVARVLADLADLDVATGDSSVAMASLIEALRAFQRAGQQRGVARQIEALACALSRRTAFATAVTLAAAADAIRQRIRVPVWAREQASLDEALARARQRLPATEYEHAWAAGRSMTIEQLTQLAAAAL